MPKEDLNVEVSSAFSEGAQTSIDRQQSASDVVKRPRPASKGAVIFKNTAAWRQLSAAEL
jgi:hypothetical protein